MVGREIAKENADAHASFKIQLGADNSATTRMSKVDGKWLFDGTVSEAN